MAQSASTPESRTLITPTIRAVPAKGGSAGPFSGSCCYQGATWLSAPFAELLHPGIMGCCISRGVPLASFKVQAAKTQRERALPRISVGTSNRDLMEQGTSPTYSTVTAVLLSRPGAVV